MDLTWNLELNLLVVTVEASAFWDGGHKRLEVDLSMRRHKQGHLNPEAPSFKPQQG